MLPGRLHNSFFVCNATRKGFLRNFCGLIKTDTIRVITTALRRMSRKISIFQILDSLRKGDGHFNIQGLKGILFQFLVSTFSGVELFLELLSIVMGSQVGRHPMS